MNKKLLAIPALMVIATVGFATQASAESLSDSAGATTVITAPNTNANTNANLQNENQDNQSQDHASNQYGQSAMHRNDEGRHATNGAYGLVTAISGDTITITTLAHGEDAIAETLTVNATGAVVDKNKVTTALSSVAVGDMIFVEGTVNGTSVTATKIHDGVMMKGWAKTHGADKTDASANAMAMLEGNGQPIVGGTVSAINGNSITITNKSNASYTVDISNAKITKNGSASAASTISVGDTILVQGTINGTAVTAVNIVDSANASAHANAHAGFFGAIGNFFAHLFGFHL